jgi:hypothetical protein
MASKKLVIPRLRLQQSRNLLVDTKVDSSHRFE